MRNWPLYDGGFDGLGPEPVTTGVSVLPVIFVLGLVNLGLEKLVRWADALFQAHPWLRVKAELAVLKWEAFWQWLGGFLDWLSR